MPWPDYRGRVAGAPVSLKGMRVTLSPSPQPPTLLAHFFSPSCSTNFSNRSGWFILMAEVGVARACVCLCVRVVRSKGKGPPQEEKTDYAVHTVSFRFGHIT